MMGCTMIDMFIFFQGYGPHRHIHVLTHAFPPRRSSDLSKDQESAYHAVRDGVLQYTRRAVYPGPEEQLDMPQGIESNPQALDDYLDGVFERSEEHTSELQSLMRTSYAVFCLKQKNTCHEMEENTTFHNQHQITVL